MTKRRWIWIGASLVAAVAAIHWGPDVIDAFDEISEGHPGLPTCTGSGGLDTVKGAFNESPTGRTMGLQIIEITNPQTVSVAPARVDCKATAMLNNDERSTITYNFTPLANGGYNAAMKLENPGGLIGQLQQLQQLLGPPATEEQRAAQAAKDCKDNTVMNANLIAMYRNAATLTPDKAAADADRKAADAIAAQCPQ